MSGHIPSSFIDNLLAQADIVDVIGDSLSLRKSGNNYIAHCPFHQEKTPSFIVSPQKQIYHCFGCGVGGGVISFLMAYKHLDYVEAIEALATRMGMDVPRETARHQQTSNNQSLYKIMERAAKFYQKTLHEPAGKAALDYLKQHRGLSDEIIERFWLGYSPPSRKILSGKTNGKPSLREKLLQTGLIIQDIENRSVFDRFWNRIMFPIRRHTGKVIGFGGRVMDDQLPKYLNSPETTLFHKGETLYGLYEMLQVNRHLKTILVVEGYMDVIALAQHDINYAVATLGTAMTTQHIERLTRLSKKIVLCFDGDEAGRKAAWRALENVLSVWQDDWDIKFMFLPDGEDPDSLVRKIGKETYEAQLEKADSLSTFFFNYLRIDLDISRPDGAAQFADKVFSYLTKISASLMQTLLLKELASLTAIPLAKLESLLALKRNSTKVRSFYKKASEKKGAQMHPLIEHAIAILLQHPEQIQPQIKTINLPLLQEADLLQTLMGLLKNPVQFTTGSLLEHFRETTFFEQLLPLAHKEIIIPPEGVKAEFCGIVERLYERHIREKIARFMVKGKDLTQSEKDELHRLQDELFQQ